MRILHVTKKYPDAIGGDANVVHYLEVLQRQHGHDVTILTTNCKEIVEAGHVLKFGIPDCAEQYDRVTLKRIVSLIILFFASFHVLSAYKPDIIHSHSADLGFLTSLTARLFRIPIIHTCHGTCFNLQGFPLPKRMMELFFLKYGGFRTVITVDKTSLPDFAKRGIGNVIFIPNGVDIDHFSSLPKVAGSGPTRFLFVGRLEHQKGLDVLIKAVRCLKEEREDFEVTIIGQGSQAEEIARLISGYALDRSVFLLGVVGREELRRHYASADVFLLPSRWEGMPLTLLEAWAAGLPAIVSRVGGLADLCKDLANAVVVSPGDARALCDAMRFLMDHPDIARRLGSGGNECARNGYSWESVSRRYEDLYQNVVESRA